MMDIALVIGRLTSDVHVAYTRDGVAVAHFTLASDRNQPRDPKTGHTPADFVDCTMFGFQSRKTGQVDNNRVKNLSTYAGKGSLLSVSGRIKQDIRNVSGQNVYTQYVRVRQYNFLGSNNRPANNSYSHQGRRTRQAPADPLAKGPAKFAGGKNPSMKQDPFKKQATNNSGKKELTGQDVAKKLASKGKKVDISEDDLPF